MKNSFCVFPCIPWSISSSRFDGSEDFVRQSLAYTKQLSVHQPRPFHVELPAILAEVIRPASVDPQSGSEANKSPNPVNLSDIGSCNTRSRVARRSLTEASA
jgi:hypothetical protein